MVAVLCMRERIGKDLVIQLMGTPTKGHDEDRNLCWYFHTNAYLMLEFDEEQRVSGAHVIADG
jgi:hypothetical protein